MPLSHTTIAFRSLGKKSSASSWTTDSDFENHCLDSTMAGHFYTVPQEKKRGGVEVPNPGKRPSPKLGPHWPPAPKDWCQPWPINSKKCVPGHKGKEVNMWRASISQSRILDLPVEENKLRYKLLQNCPLGMNLRHAPTLLIISSPVFTSWEVPVLPFEFCFLQRTNSWLSSFLQL